MPKLGSVPETNNVCKVCARPLRHTPSARQARAAGSPMTNETISALPPQASTPDGGTKLHPQQENSNKYGHFRKLYKA